jgi:hypothetical protein
MERSWELDLLIHLTVESLLPHSPLSNADRKLKEISYRVGGLDHLTDIEPKGSFTGAQDHGSKSRQQSISNTASCSSHPR